MTIGISPSDLLECRSEYYRYENVCDCYSQIHGAVEV
jgi:hypothetical protein